MTEPVLVPRGGGEIVGDTPERRVEILADHATLHATWSRFGPRSVGADLHIHRNHTDLFYVLDGQLTLGLGLEDRPVHVPPGKLVRIPPLVVHGFRNETDAKLEYLNFHAPGCDFADYLRGLREGSPVSFDQHDPGPDAARPATEAVIGGEEPVLDAPAVQMSLLADVDETGIAIVRVDPGAPTGRKHLHPRHAESFYVLEGELTIAAGESELRAEVGSWAQVPPGTPHTTASTGDRPVRFLVLHTPSSGFGDFARALGRGVAAEAAVEQTGFDLLAVP